MARFSGVIGYGEQVKKAPGVWEDVITERGPYLGDVIRNSRQFRDGEGVNNDLSVSNSISIMPDVYANEHIFAIRYVHWAGTLWTVTNVEVQSPRLVLAIGGVYNGPKA